jgi:hypothetical protein
MNRCTSIVAFLVVVCCPFAAKAQVNNDKSPYKTWQHNGLMAIITTPEGAALPESASEANVPVLVRLHKDFFDFKQASPKGDDIRFSTLAGEALAYQVEDWDAEKAKPRSGCASRKLSAMPGSRSDSIGAWRARPVSRTARRFSMTQTDS